MKGLFMSAVLACVMLGATQSSHADSLVFFANLNGPAEFPPNASPGTGFALVTFDTTAHTMRVQVTFSGLTAPTTVAHIHSPTAIPFAGAIGVATGLPTFTDFPPGVTSGSYDHTFDTSLLTTYNPAFVTAFGGGTALGAEAALIAQIQEGRAYLNVHSSAFPGGEIRGFLEPVPEPATMLLLGTGLAGVALKFRRSRQAKKSG